MRKRNNAEHVRIGITTRPNVSAKIQAYEPITKAKSKSQTARMELEKLFD